MSVVDRTLVSFAFAIATGLGIMFGTTVGVFNGPRLVQHADCADRPITFASLQVPFRGTYGE